MIAFTQNRCSHYAQVTICVPKRKYPVSLSTVFLRDTFGSYMNLTLVTEQVMQLRNRTNVLLYYTANEPDGSEDPFSAPVSASAQMVHRIHTDRRL